MTASGGRHMLQHAAKLCPWVRVGADLPNHPKIHQEEFCPQHRWNPPSVDPWLSSGWCCSHQQHLLSQIFGAFWWVCAYPLSVSTILTLPPDAAILFLPVLRSLTQLPSRENCFALRRVFISFSGEDFLNSLHNFEGIPQWWSSIGVLHCRRFMTLWSALGSEAVAMIKRKCNLKSYGSLLDGSACLLAKTKMRITLVVPALRIATL